MRFFSGSRPTLSPDLHDLPHVGNMLVEKEIQKLFCAGGAISNVMHCAKKYIDMISTNIQLLMELPFSRDLVAGAR